MTDFKPGDRVRGFASGRPEGRERTEGTVEDVGSTGWVQLENGFSLDPTRPIELIETPKLTKLFSEPAPRPLVGPAPTPPAAPRYVAPFEAKGDYIEDAAGTAVLCVSASVRTDDVEDFATYVATALNASVFNED